MRAPLLQKQFGDAGSGFVLIARPWAWYSHRGVEMDASSWKIDIAGATAVEGRNARLGRRQLPRLRRERWRTGR